MNTSVSPEVDLVVDTDIKGVNDDAFALHYLLSRDRVPSAITTCSGNTLARDSLTDVRALLASYAVETHTWAGPDSPRGWTPPVHAYHLELREKLGSSAYLGELGSPRTRAAPEAESPTTGWSGAQPLTTPTVDYLALGPLGNLHDALASETLPAERIRHLVFSGGAFEVQGNIGRYAEFNVLADPLAAAHVLAAPLPRITVVPLDVTTELTYGLTEFLHITSGRGPFSRDLARTKGPTFEARPDFREPLWDLVAALVMTHPEIVTHSVRGEVSVDTSLTASLGATRLRPCADGRAEVVLEVDAGQVLHHMAHAFKEDAL
ncbi:nucleoside hydrolase [Streptomyces sp. NPDC006458]|uniref:nucleoside hydrolase n=1 Tax=Streptomyces sp. NPDC006458 TaxID=3154302 RepID=UPI0033AE429A